ncbi:unnamed protein product [Bursaphelenchus xylophilus]|uniref:(pine wood nematode) hypothetical protein n=1 Tax=Bursaphelenchus xylophilus TaxID=6326 RepID=A0A7I8WZ79_BURXY|nr:unnamed protein product [Bursaphelenchus xylophilus]CAG9102440.1 unnamed protein product [Bursaphelenchus xylophilus]
MKKELLIKGHGIRGPERNESAAEGGAAMKAPSFLTLLYKRQEEGASLIYPAIFHFSCQPLQGQEAVFVCTLLGEFVGI